MASYSNTPTHEPQPARQIPVQMEQLGNAVDVLDKNIAMLAEGLRTVLIQEVACDPHESATPALPLCGQATAIRSVTDNIERLSEIVRQLCHDLQL